MQPNQNPQNLQFQYGPVAHTYPQYSGQNQLIQTQQGFNQMQNPYGFQPRLNDGSQFNSLQPRYGQGELIYDTRDLHRNDQSCFLQANHQNLGFQQIQSPSCNSAPLPSINQNLRPGAAQNNFSNPVFSQSNSQFDDVDENARDDKAMNEQLDMSYTRVQLEPMFKNTCRFLIKNQKLLNAGLDKVQSLIQSKTQLGVYRKIIDGAQKVIKDKKSHEKLMDNKRRVVSAPGHIPAKKSLIVVEMNSRYNDTMSSIQKSKSKRHYLEKREREMPIIAGCGNGVCTNRRDVMISDCRHLGLCNVCFTNNILLAFVTVCPVCKVAWNAPKAGVQIFY